MLDETRKPIRAGLAYLSGVRDDPAALGAWQRVQTRLQASGGTMRTVLELIDNARSSATKHTQELLQPYHDLTIGESGAALGAALRGDFERLHAVVEAYPELQQDADDLERAVHERQHHEQQQAAVAQHLGGALANALDRCTVSPPTLDDPTFWSSITPLGEQIREAVREEKREQRPPKERMKREVAEPLIAGHLVRRPHDTAKQVSEEVGCSTGVVAESKAWKLNRKRLRASKLAGNDPKAVKLNERAVNAVGGSRMRQLRDCRQQADGIVDEIDQRDQELFRRIGEYQNDHPTETPDQVARAVGCTAGEVESRQATLNRLVSEQVDDQQEDIAAGDANTKRGPGQKWVRKQV